MKHGGVNATVPEALKPDELTLEQALELLAAKGGKAAPKPRAARARGPANPAAAAAAAPSRSPRTPASARGTAGDGARDGEDRPARHGENPSEDPRAHGSREEERRGQARRGQAHDAQVGAPLREFPRAGEALPSACGTASSDPSAPCVGS